MNPASSFFTSGVILGFACALGAGLLWGLVFITPLVLGDYPGVMLSFGRYIGFGLIALVPAFFDRQRIAALSKADWITAIKLSMVGNLLYYAALATAIQLADAPLPAMLIGTLPVIISIVSNWSPGHPSESVPWKNLAPSLIIIFAGLMLVNLNELSHLDAKRSVPDYVLGCAIALIALAAWTWYPIMNARYIKAHPAIRSTTWATAQGLTTLPLALIGFAAYGAYTKIGGGSFDFPLGPRPAIYIGMMLLLGFSASWLGTLLWNKASQCLPTSLAGQLIVFETLAALLYAFIWRGVMPNLQVISGIVLLIVGVIFGVRTFSVARRGSDDDLPIEPHP